MNVLPKRRLLLCFGLLLCVGLCLIGCPKRSLTKGPYIIVLGIAQDGGYPQAGCDKSCCQRAWRLPKKQRSPASLALVDPTTKQRWLFEATPDIRKQLKQLDLIAPYNKPQIISGIFLTHGHIGHYTGLMHLGREVMGTKSIPVYAMPRMRSFLTKNGPWSQLVKLKNIELKALTNNKPIELSKTLSVLPIEVPHRDEFTETVGFVIKGPKRKVLFLPDIDKWAKWKTPVESIIEKVDVAYIDGTFFNGKELPGRDMSKIPHPSIQESIKRFKGLPLKERTKIRFIHLNHTNPVLRSSSSSWQSVYKAGMRVAKQHEFINL